ncbi:response regulator transcription factor [Anaerocolumna sp. MB42-C2]|uniref:response regulator transcription factor n=1 Tax=Anaerocolumna sp. MB42-C2 TaxID=3070997 RepID=UPI0027DFAE0A|nr:response regulator [Anaerocolumna sp. MB42-C2]WMJ89008.1 response regulator [Anaerocolumna sp. MB42-C2]
MYKVMIVDDEVLVRVGLKTTINWESAGFSIVSEASNGEQAYDNYLKFKPDVIITDIKMPKQDGLWLVEQIRKDNTEAQILVLTCYDEFTIVRKALKAGANDYILKSEIEDEELIKLMASVKEKLDSQSRNEADKRNEPNLEELKRTLAADLVRKGFKVDDRLYNALKKADFPVIDTSFAFMCITLVSNVDDQTDMVQVGFAVMNILFEQFHQNDLNCIDIQQSNMFLLFISSSNLRAAEIKRMFNAADNGAMQYFNISLNAVFSPVFLHLEQAGEIYKDFSEKSAVLFYRLKNSNRILSADTINFSEPNVSDLKKIYNKNFLEAIGYENVDKVKEMIKEIGQYFEDNLVSPMIVKIFYSNLIGDIFSSYGLYLADREMFESHKSYHYQITQSDQLKNINRLFLELAEKLISEIRKVRNYNSKFMINQALNYIKYHYMEKISLDDVADEMNISKHYLSSIFKKETGENMSLYINKLRIEKAKQLLLESDIKIKEVFEKVGYSDQQYFSKVFKKITGKTVVEYKEGMGKK